MFTRQRALGLVCTSLLAAAAAAQTPPPSSAGIFPLSAVHAGLQGTAYTVFQGDLPESLGVEILGVLRNAEGPGEDLILARLTGAHVEYTGVVAGMSGSPVYIDGKLAGAISYRIGQFSKEPIAGITPIAEMLTVRDLQPGRLPAVSTGDIRPIDTPLIFTGFSPEAISLWKSHAPDLGMKAEAGLGGMAQTTAGPRKLLAAAPPLEPGSAVSALIVSGDMEIAATCTVTYLQNGHLLACGHPLTQVGGVSMPMTKAHVLATLPSPQDSFKIVNTGETVGAFTEDRQTAIAGLLGAQARTIPVTIQIDRPYAQKTIHLGLIDQAQLTPTAVLVTMFQALQEQPEYAQEDSYRVHASLQVAGYPPVHVDALAAPGGLGGSALGAALAVAQDFDALYSSNTRRAGFTGADIHVDVLPGPRTATLTRAAVQQTVIHAGQRITVSATVAPYRGATRTLNIPVVLPAGLAQGEVRLLVSDGGTLNRLNGTPDTSAAPLARTVAALNAQQPDDRLYVTLLAPDAEATIDGQELSALPPSVANLLLPAHEQDRKSLRSESPQILTSVPMDADFSGQQVLTVQVE